MKIVLLSLPVRTQIIADVTSTNEIVTIKTVNNRPNNINVLLKQNNR